MSAGDLRFLRFDFRGYCCKKAQNAQKVAKTPYRRLVNPFLIALLFLASTALAEQRFPPPDFEGGHQLPVTLQPAARALFFQYLDVAVLAASLGVATWLVHKKRSRRTLLTLSIFSLLYFGFYRKGCVCSIGSVQNIALALGDPGYAAPLTVIGFFLLPLIFSLFWGRAFCAGVSWSRAP